MEMRIKQEKGQANFEEIKEFVYLTKHGVALVNEEGDEKLYLKENLNNLFCVINQNNINDIEYIQNDFMLIETVNDTVKGFNITLISGEKYTIEVL